MELFLWNYDVPQALTFIPLERRLKCKQWKATRGKLCIVTVCLSRRPVASVRVTCWGAGEGRRRGMALANYRAEGVHPRGKNAVTRGARNQRVNLRRPKGLPRLTFKWRRQSRVTPGDVGPRARVQLCCLRCGKGRLSVLGLPWSHTTY